MATRNKLVISCMDRRLNKILDKENDGNTIMLRNAGANANGLYGSIKRAIENDVSTIKLMAHSDCGAMKVVYNSIKEGAEASEEIDSTLISQFEGKQFSTRNELESLNEALQTEELEKISNGVEIEKSFVDLSKYTFNEPKEHVAAFVHPSSEKYEEICKKAGLGVDDTYFIQAESIEEVYADLEIAITKLGIKRIAAIAMMPSEYRAMHAEVQKLKMKEFAKSAEVSLIKL
ncbi:MAG: carbonic anhydrase [Candidatus Micrarchaeia archaeon]